MTAMIVMTKMMMITKRSPSKMEEAFLLKTRDGYASFSHLNELLNHLIETYGINLSLKDLQYTVTHNGVFYTATNGQIIMVMKYNRMEGWNFAVRMRH